MNHVCLIWDDESSLHQAGSPMRRRRPRRAALTAHTARRRRYCLRQYAAAS